MLTLGYTDFSKQIMSIADGNENMSFVASRPLTGEYRSNSD